MLAVLLALPVMADDAKPVPVPQITVEQKLDYQRARADLLVAQAEVARTQKILEEKIAAMQKTCGTRQVITDATANRDPMCEVKDEKK